MLFSKILRAPDSPPSPTPITPLGNSVPQAATQNVSIPASASQTIILLVDDSSMVRSMVAKTLVSHGFEIIAADSGLTGLTEWEKRKAEIKLVLSDIFMPGMDGLTFGKELRKRSRSLPIILMSSKLDDDSRWIAEEAGFRLLSKPFKDELLIETINRMLRLAYRV